MKNTFPAKLDDELRRQIEQALRKAAPNQRLACREALRLANEQGVAPAAIGQLADALSIRIVGCQLGCF